MAVTPLYRELLRRQMQYLRLRPRKIGAQRRSQSSSSNAAKPKTTRDEDPIPVPNNVPQIPLWERLGPLTRLAQAYARVQRKRPYVTQLCSTLVIYFSADLSAQRIRGKDYEPERTARSLVIGAISAIPSYKWFMFLSHSFNYSSRVLSLATKVVVNQLCFTPVFNSYFFGMQALLAGENPVEIWERIKRTVPVSFVNSLKLWPAVTAFSFTFVPIEYRSVFAGVIAVGWQTYLAYLNRQAEAEQEAKKSPNPSPSLGAMVA